MFPLRFPTVWDLGGAGRMAQGYTRGQVYVDTMNDSKVLELSVDVVDQLAALADSVRLAIVQQLATYGTQCVCDLNTHAQVSPTKLSYHLKILKDAGLIRGTRRGRWIDYALVPGAFDEMAGILHQLGRATEKAALS